MEFDLPTDLEELAKISINSFKNKVRKKAKEVAFFTFLELKENHSKLENLFYKDLKMQNYFHLENLTYIQAQLVFSYRARMANFGENYRRPGGPTICPLCHNHCDGQHWSFQCKTICENLNVEGNYKSIFSDNIPRQTIQTIEKIEKFRQEFLQERKIK